MGYTKDVVKGVSWTGFLSAFTKAVGFIEAIILARILIPSQFGAYGVALLALGFLEVITESGVNIILVQEKNIENMISSAWIISILRGILISVVLFLLSPFIANFFHSSESLILLYVISLAPLLRGLINPSVINLQKNLEFAKNFWYRFVILLVDTTMSITVTYITKNPIGIVVGLLSGVVMELALSFILIRPLPSLSITKEYINNILHRGKWITASSIFDYLFFNADNIAVGRILGAGALGVYQLAYSLSATPLSEVGRVFVTVTTPILVKINDDSKRLKKAYLRTVVSISLITLPFAFLFASFPKISTIILGEKWSEVAVILPILGVLGFVKAVSISSSALFISLKKQEYTTVVTLVNILGLVVSIVPLIGAYGILGAGFSALIGALLAVPFIIFFVSRAFSKS